MKVMGIFVTVRWIKTSDESTQLIHLGDTPVIDFGWLLSLNSNVQEIDIDFDHDEIVLNRKPASGEQRPLTAEGLAMLVRARAAELRNI